MSVSTIARAAMLLAVAAAAAPLFAQDTASCHCRVIYDSHAPNAFERRSAGALSFIQGRPQDSFGHNVGLGYGIDGTYLFRLDRAGFFGMRADAGILQYGSESKQVPLSSTIGGRIQVDVATKNYIVPLWIGPQIMWPRGAVRPYANAGVGGQLFFTTSSVQGTNDDEAFASTTNQWDKSLAWVAGGGVYLPVYQRRFNVLLDLGAQYLHGGRARYLRPGSIEDLPDSQIRITPLESNTHVVLVRLGVRVGM